MRLARYKHQRDRKGTMAKRLLIVEDDPNISSMTADILRLEGFDTNAVSDGPTALETLRSGRYDIVLLDVMLPGMDGFTIMRAIRDDPVLAATSVVMLTARSDDASTWEGWKAGCDYFLPKPFDPEE